MIRKTIAITEQQNEWLKSQISQGGYGNESEIFRDLIRSHQKKEMKSTEDIEKIRALLIEGEESGISNRTVDEIWADARNRLENPNA